MNIKTKAILYFVLLLILLVTLLIILNQLTIKTYPTIIWSYWDKGDIPKIQLDIFENRKKVLSNYTHILVTENTISSYIRRKPPAGFAKLRPPAQSDWVRLALLNENGGCWLDIAIIVNSKADFDNIFREAITSKSDVTGFYLERDIADNDPLSFFESWFILAPKNTSFINEWLTQFERAIDIGFIKYRELVEEPYKCQHIYSKYNTYLTIHVTFRVALQNRFIKPKIIVYKAEDTMYKLRSICGWDSKGCIMKKIRDEPSQTRQIPFIKLNGPETGSGIDISNYFKE